MRSSAAVFLCRVVTVACLLFAVQAQAARNVTIAVVTDGDWARVTDYVSTTEREIRDLLSPEFRVTIDRSAQFSGDWQLAKIRKAFDAAMRSSRVDIVIAAGPLVSEYAVQQQRLSKPVIAPVIIDTDAQRVPRKGSGDNQTSGRRNLTYLDPFTSLGLDLKTFHKTVPFTELAVVVDREFSAGLGGLNNRLLTTAEELGVALSIIPVVSQPNEVLNALDPGIEAVMVLPLLRFTNASMGLLADGLVERGLPSFSSFGTLDVEQGILMTATPATDVTRIARRIALNVQQILLGTPASQLKVQFRLNQALTLNVATAERIGFAPGFALLEDANLIGQDQLPNAPLLELDAAMSEAVARNVQLGERDARVSIAAADAALASAQRRPALNLGLRGRQIDSDRARASFGTQPEKRLEAVITLRQLLYNEQANTSAANAKQLQLARRFDRQAAQLDVVESTALTYLNVLRAETLERVERDNLKVTKANLKRAEVREQVGLRGRADVLRWQTALAQDRQAVLRAKASSEQARVALNQLLNRPLSQGFSTLAPALDDPRLLVGNSEYLDYVDNRRDFDRFRRFMAAEAVRNAPEVQAIDAALKAGQRSLITARRSRFLPQVALEAEYGYQLYEGGEGSDGAGGSFPGFQPADDENWQLGIQAELPLFTGGRQRAQVDQAVANLQQLSQQRLGLNEQLRSRMQSALIATSSSQPAIRLAQQAAEAAGQNLAIVTDAYSRGAVPIFELLDAQNAALSAEQSAANANFNFFADLIQVQRAYGRFDYFMTAAERAGYFTRLEAWFARPQS